MEPDLHRHADCDEYGKFVESTARRDRPHRDLRCLQRDRATVPANLRGQHLASWRIASGRGDRCGIHRARRLLPVLVAAPTGGLDARYAASLAALGDEARRRIARTRHRVGNGSRAGSARLAGDRRVQSPSFSSLHWRTGGRPVAADGRVMRRNERGGAGIHRTIRAGQHHPVRSWTATKPGEPDLWRRFQHRQAARSKHGLDALRGTEPARAVLGRQRQRALESGGEPDRTRQPPVDFRE